MKTSVLASGSKGNSTYIETKTMKIMVDFGLSLTYIKDKLSELNTNIKDIDGIFITHAHDDHINGLEQLIKKYDIPIYLSETMYNELKSRLPISNYVIIDTYLKLKELEINILKMSHDSGDVNAYIFKEKNIELAYITDTGYINARYHKQLKNKDIYIIESNHDIEMLINGPYPHHLKRRIISDKGHLSNIDCATYLSKFIGDKTKNIILIHLSEKNNSEEKVRETIEIVLKDSSIDPNNIIISLQDRKTELVSID